MSETVLSGGVQPRSQLRKAIGPGILLAGAAVGGSHLVASTQAGAHYGWALLVVVLLVNLFKYPFFLYGVRYTAATGETILHGYHRLGRGYLWSFFALNLLNAVLNIAGVALITGSLALNFGLHRVVDDKTLAIVMSVLCAAIIIFGRYRALDGMTKAIMLLLTASTVAAVTMAALQGPSGDPDFVSPSPWNLAAVGFLIQFMGWMPAPIDVGAWPSLWMMSREKETGFRASMRHALIDFHIGYIGTVVLAVVFLALGVLVMHGTGETFGVTGGQFSQDFIRMYVRSIGAWAEPVVAIAAFTTMFSTTLTCVDAYPRSLAVSTALAFDRERDWARFHVAWILFTVAIGVVITQFFVANLSQLLFFAMAVSFTTSPVFAWINFRAMRADWVPASERPGRFMTALSWTGLAFLTLSTLAFVAWLVLR